MPMKQRCMNLLALLIFVVPVANCPAATITWKPNRAGDWPDGANWEAGRIPAAGDDVVITAPGAKVLLRNSTPRLGSFVLSGTLTFSGWETKLNTAALTVKSGGWITHAGPFKEKTQTARVLIHCAGTLTIEKH